MLSMLIGGDMVQTARFDEKFEPMKCSVKNARAAEPQGKLTWIEPERHGDDDVEAYKTACQTYS